MPLTHTHLLLIDPFFSGTRETPPQPARIDFALSDRGDLVQWPGAWGAAAKGPSLGPGVLRIAGAQGAGILPADLQDRGGSPGKRRFELPRPHPVNLEVGIPQCATHLCAQVAEETRCIYTGDVLFRKP